jgi:DNA-binding MarR family transcriptional regulator
MRVLGELGPLTPGELAAVLHLHPASVTRLAKRLEARKILRRRHHPEDGRKLVLELGPAAARLARPLRGTVEGAVREALVGLKNADIQTAVALAARLTEALERG